MSSQTKTFKRIKYEPITVKEPHKYDVKEFENPDEFTAYYRENEDEFKGVSTLVLNRTYKVPGYRISVAKRGTENEELMLKKDYYGPSTNVTTPKSQAVEPLPPLQELIARIENIEAFLEQWK